MNASSRPLAPARIAAVEPDSPAAAAGLKPGDAITVVAGKPLRDVIQWRWESCDDTVDIEGQTADGAAFALTLERDEGQQWGIEFDGLVFDGIARCANHCTFCFIDGMPEGLRPSLTVRDDDYRLSFLTGTFATLSNLSGADEARIIDEGLSPLRVSLHAVNPAVRARLIGPLAARGLEICERLLDAGIEMHFQIVLVPGINDGAVLEETLEWALAQEGALSVGVVPVGYTRYSPLQVGFDSPAAALAVLATIEPFARRAEASGRGRWVYAADEFYVQAYGAALLDHLPSAAFYGDFELFEDGIGIIRTTVDELACALKNGAGNRLLAALDKVNPEANVALVVGEAMMPWFEDLLARSPLAGRIRPVVVRNDFFGGNVDVTGLLCGEDIAAAVGAFQRTHPDAPIACWAVPSLIFNDDGLTLDGWSRADLESATGATLAMVSLTDSLWLDDLACAVSSASAFESV